MNWIVCQIGAREHYAIPRALAGQRALEALITDFWVPPGSVISRMPRLADRFHPELTDAKIWVSNGRFLAFEIRQRFTKRSGWPVILERNRLFQKRTLQTLRRIESRMPGSGAPTLFSYSYAARDLFRFAKERGWTTVLGQIDPGPEEERIVAEEHRRYPSLGSRWQPAPASYWDSWREEVELADRIVVNSQWSKECLLKESVPEAKMEVVSLVFQKNEPENAEMPKSEERRKSQGFRLLFLGQINLRKGIGRLLDAMRMLRDEPVELTLVGPCEIDPAAWSDLPKVRWVGPVPRGEVARYYQDADVFILPTLSDGYALTQLESLSHDLPVIASRHCGEVVRHGANGWILENLEPDFLARAILRATQQRLSGNNNSSEFDFEKLGMLLCK